MTRILTLALLAGLPALAQKPLTVTFNSGIGFQIHTESSASRTPLSTQGSVHVGSGNVSRRAVMDSAGGTIFSYDIEMLRHGPYALVMRFKPVPGEGVRTLRTMKQSPPLLPGDTMEVDILQNPASGERLYDVVRVTDARTPPPGPPPDLFSLYKPTVLVNGKVVREETNFWMRGGALMIRIPDKGDYYLNLGPSAKHPFRPLGWVDRETLRFQAGGDLIEIVGKTKLLKRGDFRTIWIYLDPESVAAARMLDRVEFTCGDDGDQLLADLRPSK